MAIIYKICWHCGMHLRKRLRKCWACKCIQHDYMRYPDTDTRQLKIDREQKKKANPTPQKFNKDRSVDFEWEKIPIYYTGIRHPKDRRKELVLVQQFGKSVSACWRNNALSKMGITFLLKLTDDGFIFKGRRYTYRKRAGWVW